MNLNRYETWCTSLHSRFDTRQDALTLNLKIGIKSIRTIACFDPSPSNNIQLSGFGCNKL